MGLRVGDGVEEEKEESLSSAGVFSVMGRCKEIMSLPCSRDEYAFMLVKERSGSSNSVELMVEAMALYDGSWQCFMKKGALKNRVTVAELSYLQDTLFTRISTPGL